MLPALPNGLTGAVSGADSRAVAEADESLRYAAGNFYVNDKPTGSVVGQQPFGGARVSGTNDKAGTVWNLIRPASPRAVKRRYVQSCLNFTLRHSGRHHDRGQFGNVFDLFWP